MGYENWDIMANFICSSHMVDVGTFSNVLNNIFRYVVNDPAYAIRTINEMYKDGLGKNKRFPAEGTFIILGDKIVAENLDEIRGHLMIIAQIHAKSNPGVAELSFMKETVKNLKDTVSSLREHLITGKSIYNRKFFEDRLCLIWYGKE